MKLCGFEVGLDKPFFLMAGPCVIESEEMVMDIAREMKAICADLGIPYIFKASYDKANRTSGASFRGPGIEKGLEILARVRKTVGVPVVTDVHTEADVELVAKYVDVKRISFAPVPARVNPSILKRASSWRRMT